MILLILLLLLFLNLLMASLHLLWLCLQQCGPGQLWVLPPTQLSDFKRGAGGATFIPQ